MTSYREAGVDIDAATQANALMSAAVRSTYTPQVLAGMGAFGGCFALDDQQVLVASTDGVGTKTLVAAALGRYDTVGQDLVNHAINDILVQGARPLFFLDYIALAQLDPQQVADLVGGVAAACRAAGVALIGGETAQMPDVYRDGAFDLAGTIVGLVQRDAMLPRGVAAGDAILALPSSGLHTNGYSLARRLVAEIGYDARPDLLLGESVGDALLAVHRCYVPQVTVWQAAGIALHALAHITGGGLWDNLPRVLPAGLGAELRRGSWQVPPICRLLVDLGKLDEYEAYHALNMGLGMLAIVPAAAADAARAAVPEALVAGAVVAGPGVRLVDMIP